jgi:5-hydroxyisourate hydrolase-like protein (transthyretin family)
MSLRTPRPAPPTRRPRKARRWPLGLLAGLAVLACDPTDERTTLLHIEGTVTDARTGEPIPQAEVTLHLMHWSTSDLLTGTRTDAHGRYSLTRLEHGFCPEALYNIAATAPAHIMVAYTTMQPDAPYVRCTSDPQTIDFALEPLGE